MMVTLIPDRCLQCHQLASNMCLSKIRSNGHRWENVKLVFAIWPSTERRSQILIKHVHEFNDRNELTDCTKQCWHLAIVSTLCRVHNANIATQWRDALGEYPIKALPLSLYALCIESMGHFTIDKPLLHRTLSGSTFCDIENALPPNSIWGTKC